MKRAVAALAALLLLPAVASAQKTSARKPSAPAASAHAAVKSTGDHGSDELPASKRPRVSVTVSPKKGLVTGDVVHLTITAVANRGDDVAVPKQSFDPFEVRKKKARVEKAPHGKQKLVFELELLAFDPGDHQLGPVRLRVVTADGTIGTLDTRPVTVHVGSLLANVPNAKPKPATKPIAVQQKDYTLPWIGAGLLAAAVVALLTLLGARWWQRRKLAATPPPPPRPAHEIALEKLHVLRRDRPRAEQEGRLVEWIDGVSDALRQYLGGRYGFDGLECTTDEMLTHLRRVALSPTVATEVAALLGECDLIKFAKASPEPDRCTQMLEIAYGVVHRTKPRAAPLPQPEHQEAAE